MLNLLSEVSQTCCAGMRSSIVACVGVGDMLLSALSPATCAIWCLWELLGVAACLWDVRPVLWCIWEFFAQDGVIIFGIRSGRTTLRLA